MPSAEPLQESTESRTNSQRRRRSKHAQAQAFATDESGSDAGTGPSSTSRRPPNTSSVSRAARSMLGPGSSALESQLTNDSRLYMPSLGRIAEGRSSDSREKSSTLDASRTSARPRSVRKGQARYPVESQRRLQERVRVALTSPSMQSVLSSLTTATSSSSGSNSTVTQGSFDHTDDPQSPPRRRSTAEMSSHRQEERRRRRRHSRMENDREEPQLNEKVNVFNYLVPDAASAVDAGQAWSSDGSASSSSEEDDTDHDEDSSALPRTYTPASSVTHSSSDSPVLYEKRSRPGQWPEEDASDSEHSGDDHSGPGSYNDDKQPSVRDEEDEAELTDPSDHDIDEATEANDAHLSDDVSVPVDPAHQDWSRRSSASRSDAGAHVAPIPSHLPPSYSTATSSLVPYATLPPPPPPGQVAAIDVPPPAPEPPQPHRGRRPSRSSGYDLLASRLSSHREANSEQLTPLYRRFERLNHRILLHLQDEIAEMEEHLKYLDDYIARQMQMVGDPPASRRADVRFGNELHFQRTDLLGRVFMKMKQYNEALTAYTSSVKGANRASVEDIERYRVSMAKLRPVAEEELRFLDHETDLLCIGGGDEPWPSSARGSGPKLLGAAEPEVQVQTLLAVAVPTGLVMLALLLFLAAAGPVARLVLVVALSAAGYGAMHHLQLGQGIMEYADRMKYFGGYVGLLAVMAGTIR